MSKFLELLVRSEGKSCEGKIKYPREDSAIRNAASMTEKKGNGEVFEYYKCNYCDGWHIGHRTNFDWMPQSHQAQNLMMNKYECSCGKVWITNTVFSNRILDHFPHVKYETELCVKCPKCKGVDERQIFWHGRRWVNLETISPDSTDTIEQLWENPTPTS